MLTPVVPPNQGGSEFVKPYSERTAEIIDEEVKSLVDQAYERTLKLVEERKDLVLALGERLLEQETVNHDDLVELLGNRPFEDASYSQYLVDQAPDANADDESEKSEEKEDEIIDERKPITE